MGFWTETSIREYAEACNMLRYPQEAVGEAVAGFIKPDDIVMDVGAGCGAVSAFLAPLCKKVYALESDADAFQYIKRRVAEDKLHNVQPIHGTWPMDDLPSFSVIVGFYVGGLTHTFAEMKGAMEKAGRGGIFLGNRAMGIHPVRLEVMNRLGIPLEENQFSCDNGCRAVGMLEAMGAKASCHPITHEFGQPVKNEEDAATFLFRMLHVDERYQDSFHAIAKDYIVEKDGRPFVSFIRESCLIFFEK